MYAVCALMFLQKRHHRTFSEDERIQAQESVKRVEDDDGGEISEREDPLMLQRDAKDWKVRFKRSLEAIVSVLMEIVQLGTRSLCGSWTFKVPLSCYRGTDQASSPKESPPTSSRQESCRREH